MEDDTKVKDIEKINNIDDFNTEKRQATADPNKSLAVPSIFYPAEEPSSLKKQQEIQNSGDVLEGDNEDSKKTEVMNIKSEDPLRSLS